MNRTARPFVLAAMVVFTAGNAVWSGRTRAVEPLYATLLRTGDHAPELLLREAPCQVVVAFRSDCPFCTAAAEREQQRDSIVATTWVSTTDDVGAPGYDARVHPESRVDISDARYASMKVEAVPAAVLIDSNGWIKRAWPYRGDEEVAALLRACMQPKSPPDAGRARGA